MDEREYWFMPKRFGYGATPVTWQGWALLSGFLPLALLVPVIWRLRHPTDGHVATFVIFTALAYSAVITPAIRRRTRGGWRWRWGDRD